VQRRVARLQRLEGTHEEEPGTHDQARTRRAETRGNEIDIQRMEGEGSGSGVNGLGFGVWILGFRVSTLQKHTSPQGLGI
jgi:hypothetical protein